MQVPAVSLLDVSFTWPGRNGFSLACRAFEMAQGESVLLLGASGSGKSTLLSLVCGIVAPDRGRVCVGEHELGRLSAGARDRLRAEQIGVIFQQFNLLPYASVADNILLPLHFAPKRRARARQAYGDGHGDAHREAARLCAALALPENVLDAKAGRLSVGQQQRVAVARALIGAPPLIVADEPTSALDAPTQDSFLKLLFDKLGETGSALLMVSHDERLGARFDRVIRLEEIVTKEGRAA